MILQGDCRDVLPTLEAESIDACVTDPPYELGFMGKAWDASGIAYDVAMWRAVLRVLKPGAHLLAFGGTRTHHRMVCAIEDAGFEIRDEIQWLYGSGFPKSLNVQQAMNKAAAGFPQGTADPRSPNHGKFKGGCSDENPSGRGFGAGAGAYMAETGNRRGDDEGPWKGWGTALKPAAEIICLAQKPRTAEGEQCITVENLNTLEAQLWSLLPASIAAESFGLSPSEYDAVCASARWSAGERDSIRAALSDRMDTSRFVWAIGMSLSTVSSWRSILGDLLNHGSTSTTETNASLTTDLRILNSCLSGLTPRTIIEAATSPDGLTLSALPAARAFAAVAQRLSATHDLSAIASAIARAPTSLPEGTGRAIEPAHEPICVARKPLVGTVAANVQEHGTGALNIDGCRIEEPSTGRWPADVILDEGAAAMLDKQTGELTSGMMEPGQRRKATVGGGGYHGGFPDEATKRGTYGDSGGASRFFYVAKPSKTERGEGNTHPTVKPVALLRYLVRLVTPPGGIVLDPFAGSGTTLLAAQEEGFRCVGIELNEEYVKIAERRTAQQTLWSA